MLICVFYFAVEIWNQKCWMRANEMHCCNGFVFTIYIPYVETIPRHIFGTNLITAWQCMYTIGNFQEIWNLVWCHSFKIAVPEFHVLFLFIKSTPGSYQLLTLVQIQALIVFILIFIIVTYAAKLKFLCFSLDWSSYWEETYRPQRSSEWHSFHGTDYTHVRILKWDYDSVDVMPYLVVLWI